MNIIKALVILLGVVAYADAKDFSINDRYGRYAGFYRPDINGGYRVYNQYNSYSGSVQPKGNRFYMSDKYGRPTGSFRYK